MTTGIHERVEAGLVKAVLAEGDDFSSYKPL